MLAQLDRLYIKLRPTKMISRLVSYAFFEGRPLTTSGRWINPVVFLNYKAGSLLGSKKAVNKPIFILGTGRSGTTVLGKILSMHKDVGYLNEPKAFWHYLHDNEDLIGSYTSADAKYYLDEHDASEKMVLRANKIYNFYLATIFSKRVCDKYPELIFRIPFVKKIFPDAKFIFLTRNGNDTIHSIHNWSERLGKQSESEVHDWWGVNQRKWHLLTEQVVPKVPELSDKTEEIKALNNHRDMAAVEWICTMQEGMKLMKYNEPNVHLLRYEDLLENPEASLQKLQQFLELKADPKMNEYGKAILGSPTRYKHVELNPIISRAFDKTMNDLGY